MDRVRKRAAVFVGQADESYQSRFISGFLEKAFGYDMDVCVFSMYRKYQDTADREMGESNIFSLMVPDMFDCAVIIEDSIQTAGAADTLEERLHRTFHKPVLVIENEFGSVGVDARLLRDEDCDIEDLSGVCMCCRGRGQFIGMLRI